jgi:DNA-binding transcriptional LysR family regulator/N-acetylglutamate synthase-like GNAT family acetyltransferase
MDRVKAMQVFVEVAERQGFAPAARHLGLSTSAVSRQVKDLEAWLGLQLLNRTTRRIDLTEAGKAYLARCSQIVGAVAELETSARALGEEPQGELRVTAPVFMGRHLLGPVLPGFLARYPKVKLRLHLLDRFVDLVDEGFDLALRIAHLPDSSLIARKLGETRILMTAAPSYLAEHGLPTSTVDLRRHNCLVDTVAGASDRWPLGQNKGGGTARVAGNFSANSGEMVRDMTLAGLGISRLPDFFVAQDVAEGRLVVVLEQIEERTAGIYALYPQTRHLSGPVRALIDELVAAVDRPGGAMKLRDYRPEDRDRLIDLFRDTVRSVALGDYTKAQVRAWAPDVIDRGAWARRLAANRTLVAEADGRIVGFVELTVEGHIEMLYCHKDHQGEGVGSALLAGLERMARDLGLAQLGTDASLTARPFFEARGFQVIGRQEVELRGQCLVNFAMTKSLAADGSK